MGKDNDKITYVELDKYAKNIRHVPKFDSKTTGSKLLIEFLNWNVPIGYALGQPVINDGVLIAKICKSLGYDCFYIMNSTLKMAKKLLETVFSWKYKRVIFYYSGHGANTTDKDGDEKDGKDENLIFVGGPLVDDEFIKIINDNLKADHLSLIADCCCSGTIFDLDKLDKQLVKKVCSISACSDNQPSLQLSKNGVFTWKLTECYDKNTGLVDVKKLQDWLHEHANMDITTYGDTDELFIQKRTRGFGSFALGWAADSAVNEMTNELEQEENQQKQPRETIYIKQIV